MLRNVMVLLSMLSIRISANNITINKINGRNSRSCLQGLTSCQDLHYVLTIGLSYLNGSTVTLRPDVYEIAQHYKLQFVYNLKIQSSHASLNCVKNESGLTFVASSNILLQNLSVQYCGAQHKSTTIIRNSTDHILLKFPPAYYAVCFIYCRIVSIKNCTFSNNYGRGIAFYNVKDKLDVIASNFKNNSNIKVRSEDDIFISGGGLYIEYTLCNTSEYFTCHQFPKYNMNTNITIKNSNFQDNIADNTYENEYRHSIPVQKLYKSYQTFDSGGGIYVNFFSDASHNNVTIDTCSFENNRANWGAGLSVIFKDQAQANRILVIWSKFSDNNATYAGGGISLVSLFAKDFSDVRRKVSIGNFIHVDNSQFEVNYAIIGGGISTLATTRELYAKSNSSRDIVIGYCNFLKNRATLGSAICLNTINLNKDIIGPGMSYRVFLKQCYFKGNEVYPSEDKKVIGFGAVYSDHVTLVLSGENIFAYNTLTAVVLDSSSLLFAERSVSKFIGNIGFNGGAISLYGLSWLMFGYRCEVYFNENYVEHQGGAIYVLPGVPPRMAFQTTLLSTKQCFFRYVDSEISPDDWPVKVVFNNNRVQGTTDPEEVVYNAIYALTIQYCRSPGVPRQDLKTLKWKPFVYNNLSPSMDVMTSAIEIESPLDGFHPYPFLPYSPKMFVRDERQQNVVGNFKISFVNYKSNVHLDSSSDVFLLKNELPRMRFIGAVNHNFSFNLRSTNGLMFNSKTFYGLMHQCPHGFRPDERKDRCICMDIENNDVLKCFENETVLISKGKWGYIDKKDSLLKTLTCPTQFCGCYNQTDQFKCTLDLKMQCTENRTGNMCGACQVGYSVKIGNEDCEICHNKNLFILAVVILVLLPLFVMFILYSNFDAISRHVDAFLFFCQVSSLLMTENAPFDAVISFVIRFASFNFSGGMFGICLYDGLDNISKLGFSYVLPGSLILFTFVIAKFTPERTWRYISSKMHRRKNIGNEENFETKRRCFGRALSFLSVLCYSSITHTSFRILHSVKINGVHYVYNAPTVEYFAFPHNILMLLACLLLIFVSFGFPLFVCFEVKLAMRYRIFGYLLPIATALKSSFKAEYHYFSIFYFLWRFLATLFDILVAEEIITLIILTGLFIVSLTVFASFHPYKNRTDNVLDIIILCDVALLSLLSIVRNVPNMLQHEGKTISFIFCEILVWLPVFLTIYRVFLVWLRRKVARKVIEEDAKDDGMVRYMPVRGEDNLD